MIQAGNAKAGHGRAAIWQVRFLAMHGQVDDDLGRRWKRVAQRLRAEMGEDLYSSWFARMEPDGLADGRLLVSVPTKFLKSWIEAHYAARLNDICEAELGKLDAVTVRVRSRGRPPITPSETRDSAAFPAQAAGPRPISALSDRGSPLDPSLAFSSFVTGRSNLLAHAAAQRVAEHQPGQPVSFNPLFIHSSSGLGKTHLLNAIAWAIRERFTQRSVLYITAERFMYHFMAALKARDTLTFKDHFQTTDVLLIDDFQFLQGKTMQQEFCHTFNSLVDSRRQVIVAADVPPAQLESIDQRMRSRFAGGLVVDIEYPDLDLRRAILAKRLTDMQRRNPAAQVPDDVLEYIANRITGGGRELEGALVRVVARQEVNRGPLSIDQAALALRDLAQNPELVRVRIDDILQIVGRHYNISRADLLSPRRARSIVRPRQIGMYLAKKLTPRSLPEIGKRFGGRDHSTVLHAVRKIDELMKADERLTREVALLARLIEQH
jgi:chromosomal replication initiator protein